MNDSKFEFVGFAAIFGLAALLVALAQQALRTPEVVYAIAHRSVWLGAHSQEASWISSAVVFITALALPPLLMRRRSESGFSNLAMVGLVVCAVALVASAGFLLSVGWLGAKALLGL